MGLAKAAASLSGHESGHLQNSAGQQVKQSFHLFYTHMFTDSSGFVCPRFFLWFHVLIMILTEVFVSVHEI